MGSEESKSAGEQQPAIKQENFNPAMMMLMNDQFISEEHVRPHTENSNEDRASGPISKQVLDEGLKQDAKFYLDTLLQ